MAIEFLKDHCGFYKGQTVNHHPNWQYLIIVGVAKEVDVVKPTDNKQSVKTKKVK